MAVLSAVFLLPGAGLTFGIVSLRQPDLRRGAAIAGVTINALLLAYVFLSVVLLPMLF